MTLLAIVKNRSYKITVWLGAIHIAAMMPCWTFYLGDKIQRAIGGEAFGAAYAWLFLLLGLLPLTIIFIVFTAVKICYIMPFLICGMSLVYLAAEIKNRDFNWKNTVMLLVLDVMSFFVTTDADRVLKMIVPVNMF
ncbi:MAG: hypothetical protein IJR45_03595 [Firmicutes bacterium]|nr:hypothetical protein [Bacillota bacterium]